MTTFTIRSYLYDLLLSLIEGENKEIVDILMNYVTQQILEVSLIQVFKKLISIHLGRDIGEFQND